jgi:hypothetical protein
MTNNTQKTGNKVPVSNITKFVVALSNNSLQEHNKQNPQAQSS